MLRDTLNQSVGDKNKNTFSGHLICTPHDCLLELPFKKWSKVKLKYISLFFLYLPSEFCCSSVCSSGEKIKKWPSGWSSICCGHNKHLKVSSRTFLKLRNISVNLLWIHLTSLLQVRWMWIHRTQVRRVLSEELHEHWALNIPYITSTLHTDLHFTPQQGPPPSPLHSLSITAD